MISKETIEEVKSRARLVDIVSETVSLKKQAGRFVGLCPFHSEKSPSFHVREDESYYHCFGCGKSGNVFSFLMETRGLTFPEAIEFLAERYGIEIKRTNSKNQKPVRDHKKEIYAVNEFAVSFYKNALQQRNPSLIEYVKKRNLNREAFNEFLIGFAPLGNEFYKAAKQKFSDDILVKSGLVRRNDQGYQYDALRGRLVFPILIDKKRVAGFGGRVIPGLYRPDENPPKYLNSPETEVYHKSSMLYGMASAIDAIRHSKECYVVEGYLDVISLWQQDVKQVVATCGTALTKEHVEKLSRVAKKVIMLFDGDSAGRSAAGKSFVNFIDSPIDVWAVYLPEKEDPDTIANLYQKNSLDYLKNLPKVSLLDAFIDYQLHLLNETSIESIGSNAISHIAAELNKIFSTVKSKATLDVLFRQAANRLRVSEDTFRQPIAVKNPNYTAAPVQSSADSVSVEVEASASSVEKCPFNVLPALDRQILQLVMGKRNVFVDLVLKEGALLDSLHPVSIEFVQELAQILALNIEEQHQKLSIKALLSGYDSSWVAAWKDAHTLSANKDANFDRLFQECVTSVKRQKTNELAEELQRQASFCQDPHEKSVLLQQVLQLKRAAVG